MNDDFESKVYGKHTMKRRAFVTTAAAATLAAAAPRFAPLDYGRSFLSGVAEFNRVRFWVESRTRVIDDGTGLHQDYLQCAACKSEDTFAKQNLFYKDNYDFTPVFGPEFGLIFRRRAAATPNYREVKESGAMWGGQKMALREARVKELRTTAEIRKATHAALPLIARTEIANSDTGLRAIIEFPVKTMNIEDPKDLYQVDTGPVAFPDLSRRGGNVAETISLAFVAFNAPHFADFILEAETPLPKVPDAHVMHYSRIFSFPAVNRLYAQQL